ncbi:MAG: hypothetical protein IPI48_16675 [bacterium]|nr:hypothetical protein [bacterium]
MSRMNRVAEERDEDGHATGARHRFAVGAPMTRMVHDLRQEAEVAEMRLHKPRHQESGRKPQQSDDLELHDSSLKRPTGRTSGAAGTFGKVWQPPWSGNHYLRCGNLRISL